MIANAQFSVFEPILEYLKSVPYNVSRTTLYKATELYEGYQPEQPDSYNNCHDARIYSHFLSTGKHTIQKNFSYTKNLKYTIGLRCVLIITKFNMNYLCLCLSLFGIFASNALTS